MFQPKSKVVLSKDPNVVSSQEEEEDIAKGLTIKMIILKPFDEVCLSED
jgi:hypothetical protein